jgi:hypothetical protein
LVGGQAGRGGAALEEGGGEAEGGCGDSIKAREGAGEREEAAGHFRFLMCGLVVRFLRF